MKAPEGRPSWFARFRGGLSRIWLRLLAFNVLLVFLPAAGMLYLDTYEAQLLDAQERSMVQQGRLLAAALSGRGDLDEAEARRVLVALNQRLEARLRVLDRQGRVIADSAALGPRLEVRPSRLAGSATAGEAEAAAERAATRRSLLYRVGSTLHALWRRVSPAPELPPDRPGLYTAETPEEPLTGPAVAQALAGRYGADLRVQAGDGGAVTTLHSALPVLGGVAGADAAGRVVGAVLVSQSTGRVLTALSDVRLGIFQIIVASILAAIALTLVASTTIARPLARLRDEARALVDRRGRLTGGFQGTGKQDEIGELSGALEELTARLRHHLGATEAFASDVSHELKNPLASIRSAAEMLPEAEDPEDRHRFEGIILREVARLEGLLASVREISSIDAQLEAEVTEPVPLGRLVEAVVDGYRVRDGRIGVELDLHPAPLLVEASPERLAQIVENLLDNAVSFSPPWSTVRLTVDRADGAARLAVEDEGPGIPPDQSERIFDRFFSDRSAARQAGRGEGKGGRNGHTGLGLAIVKAVVEGYGGTIRAGNRPSGGARFEVVLPLAGPWLHPPR